MSFSTTWRVGATVAASALILSGCGMFGEKEEVQRESLAGLFGLDQDNADWRDQDVRVQELVAVCMQEKGWEYIPVVYPDDYYEYDWDPSMERERIAREGFGITYWVLYPDAYDDVDGGDWDQFTDPNEAYRESLSQAELDAYYADLYGNFDNWERPIDPEDGEWVEGDGDFDIMPIDPGWGSGCEGEAYEEVYGDQDNVDVWDELSVFYEEVYARVEADPRIIELQAGWGACMKDAGFDYRDQEEFWSTGYEELYERFNAIVGDSFYNDPFAGWTDQQIDDFWNNSTQDEIDAMFGDPYADITDDQRAQLELLLQDEITMALADHDCSSGHWETYQELAAEIEEQYIRENRAAIEDAAAKVKGA